MSGTVHVDLLRQRVLHAAKQNHPSQSTVPPHLWIVKSAGVALSCEQDQVWAAAAGWWFWTNSILDWNQGGVAQPVEQRTFNPCVVGSSPTALTILTCPFSLI